MPEPRAATTTVVVAGVSGVGKSSVGQRLAHRLGWAYADGDGFHPPQNIAKMSAGQPLTDEDRWPWLRRLADWIGEQEAAGLDAVLAASVLKRAYRDLLAAGHPSVWFCQLTAGPTLLTQRVQQRPGHYMPASLLDSQLHDLEPLGPGERGAVVRSEGTPDQVAVAVLRALGLPGAADP